MIDLDLALTVAMLSFIAGFMVRAYIHLRTGR